MTRKNPIPHERFAMIIREIAIAFARSTGTEPTRDQIKAVELEISHQFGGERLYVPSHPKATREANKRPSQQDLAKAMGISTRGLRKALTGK